MNVKLLDAIEDQLEGTRSSRMGHAARIPQHPAHAANKPRCKECGLTIRGPNHKEGDDHKRRANARAGKSAA